MLDISVTGYAMSHKESKSNYTRADPNSYKNFTDDFDFKPRLAAVFSQ